MGLRTDWMAGKYGVMVHYLLPGPAPERGSFITDINAVADGFDVAGMLEQFSRTGADWFVFTFGQNTGFYASPSQTIDRLCGPGHCTRRDLVLEIARGVHAMGKRFIGYMPCEVNANTTLHEGFAWEKREGTDQAEFQRRYTALVREWGERFGTLLDGWWFDGCYTWGVFNNSMMNWPMWYDAARAGNPDRAVTFNDGSFCGGAEAPIRPEHDYTAGETETLIDGKIRFGRGKNARVCLPSSRFVPGTQCQWHCLIPIDCFWGHGSFTTEFAKQDWLKGLRFRPVSVDYRGPMEEPIYSDAELRGFLSSVIGSGGAVTFNIGIYQEGHLAPLTVEQVARIGRVAR